MKYLEVVAEAGSADTVAAIAEKVAADDFRLSLVGEDGKQAMRILLADDRLQTALDALQNVLGAQPYARIVVLSVETSLPVAEEAKRKQEDTATMARETLYASVAKGGRFDLNFLILVALSTVVAAVGLIENNVAVVIGAMVIAPLLGPNLALSLGTALGDVKLMVGAIRTLLAGIALAMLMSVILGFLWQGKLDSFELISRTVAGWDSVVLALASGAAAALSLSSGLSGVLVGVMVAVALLPPTATAGLMLGQGNYEQAAGAALLLAINVVCINLASKLVFYFKGIGPRTWLQKEKAKKAVVIYGIVWVLTLAALMLIVFNRL